MEAMEFSLAVTVRVSHQCFYTTLLFLPLGGAFSQYTCHCHLCKIWANLQPVFKTSIHISNSPVCQLTNYLGFTINSKYSCIPTWTLVTLCNSSRCSKLTG